MDVMVAILTPHVVLMDILGTSAGADSRLELYKLPIALSIKCNLLFHRAFTTLLK